MTMSFHSTAFVCAQPVFSSIVYRNGFPRAQKRPRGVFKPRLLTRCCASGKQNVEPEGDSAPKAKPETHVSADFAITAMKEAIRLANGDVCAVAAKCASGFVDAFTQCYNLDDVTSVFIVCGPGMNGLTGLYIAVELKARGYHPAIHAAEENKHSNIPEFCKKHDIQLYDFMPSTLEFYFQVVVDAMLGLGYDGGDIKPRFWNVFEMLVSTRLAVASVDVPSGWDLQQGPRQIDVTADTFVKPEVLVSIGVPKNGSKVFAGGFHFVAGRHLPQTYFSERGITVPTFPGSDANCALISSNPFRFESYNGEVYGRPGQFNATLYTKNPTREWVDVEEDMELWDELD